MMNTGPQNTGKTNKRTEIDHHVIKLMIGLIALTLASLANFLSGEDINSISESYREVDNDFARNIFVGFLFAIAALLMSYNGRSTPEFF